MMECIVFSKNLYFSRQLGLVTFEREPGSVLVCRRGLPFSLRDLHTFLSRYVPVTEEGLAKYLGPEVLATLVRQGLLAPPLPEKESAREPERTEEAPQEQSRPRKPESSPPAPSPPTGEKKEGEKPTSPSTAIATPPEREPEEPAPSPPPATPAVAAPPPEVKRPEEPVPPPAPLPAQAVSPAGKVHAACETLKEKIVDQIHLKGVDAVLQGAFDDTIRTVVKDLYRELQPRQILSQIGRSGESSRRDRGDRVAQTTLTSQAFGQRLSLSEEELFLLAKSALLYALKEHERENLLVIKRNLLSEKPSPSFRKRLAQSYQHVVLWLKQRKVDPHLAAVIDQSRFIYYPHQKRDVTPEVLSLAVADAFLALKEGGERFLIIEEILTSRLKQVVAAPDIPLDIVPRLITESCYNEYRASCREDLGGGDWCAFTRIDRHRRGLLIFDVSGHDEEASRIRQAICDYLAEVSHVTDPAAFTTGVNTFLLEGGFPDDRFVSFLYGIIDLKEDCFTYTNAGHTPPYLIRDEQVMAVKKSDLLLNIAPCQYTTHTIPIARNDCLVLYTDGLTEARKEAGDELFGSERLADRLARRSIGAMRAKRAVQTILKLVNEEGFTVEDDLTVQVYRHL